MANESFKDGLALGLAGKPLPLTSQKEPTDAYIHDAASQTLIVNDESKLNFDFSWDTMRMDVSVK